MNSPFFNKVIRCASMVACSLCTWTRDRYVAEEHARVQPVNGDQMSLSICEGHRVHRLQYDPTQDLYSAPVNDYRERVIYFED